MSGIDACAWALAHTVDRYAVAGGEGSRRLAAAVAAVDLGRSHGGPTELPGDGVDAARAALGCALAGQRVALLASGDAVATVLPVLREMARAGAPVVLVVASHGEDTGRPLPSSGPGDMAVLLDGPAGVLLAGSVRQVGDLTLHASGRAWDRRMPWVVGFDLAAVGLATDTTGGALRAHGDGRWQDGVVPMPGPLVHDGPVEADVVLVSAGPGATGARACASGESAGTPGPRVAAVQVVSVRPWPTADLVACTLRARTVVVHEAFPVAAGMGTGGRLSDGLKAAYADVLAGEPGVGRVPCVVTVHGAGVVDPAAWQRVVCAVDVQHPPRWIRVTPEDPHPGGTPDV